MPWTLDNESAEPLRQPGQGGGRAFLQHLQRRLQNLPKRVHILAGVALTVFLLFVSVVFLTPEGSPLPGTKPAPVGNYIPAEPLWWRPSWTTESRVPRFAYVQYATNIDYLCNAVINFGRLQRFGVREEFVLIHPKQWSTEDSAEGKALAWLTDMRPEIIMRGFEVISTNKGDKTWQDSLTKFHAFALTEWTRVLVFDSDSLVLNNMDHYFLSPTASVAVPRAYWLNDKNTDIAKQVLGSHVMLIEPNKARYHKIVNEARKTGDFDMEVINHMFKDSAMILPHRRLALLTGEFRAKDHSKYLAPDEDIEWNAMAKSRERMLCTSAIGFCLSRGSRAASNSGRLPCQNAPTTTLKSRIGRDVLTR
ncbi:glucose n-acetyltransferase [Colletotrichum sojae]|uniref:Glucose n-acetyltransferase n=1 Tax=Colletotrichum sojae TaxID=2175907 RepID=A0A8H6IQI2_9PEZI|nr:glucose n-acetyltransferase [Colletotrichum sojae]